MDTQTDPALDRHPWRNAVLLGLAVVAFGMAYTMFLMPMITHRDGWWVVPGVWPPLKAARYVATGAFPYIYSGDPVISAGPIGPIVLGPIAAITDAFKLTDNYTYNVPRPSAWLVYGPYGLALGIGVLYAARAMLHRAWISERIGGPGASWPLWWAQLGMVGLVLVPAAVVYGHFEEVLALAFFLLGIRSMLSGRFLRAGLWLGLAIGTKQWAVLGVPILVAAAPPSLRGRALVRSLLLPGALMALTLAANFHDAWPALLGPRVVPQFGHAALWVSRSAGVMVGAPERLGEVAVALAVGGWLWRSCRARVLVAGFGLVLLSRLFFEPVVLAYTVAPALALLFLHELLAGRSGLRTIVGGGVLLLFFLVHPNPWVWWTLTAAASVWLAAPALGEVRRREQAPPAPELGPAVERPAADLATARA